MATTANQHLKQKKIARSFGSASISYDVSARLQRFAGKHLMPWLPNRNDFKVIDLGSGTGFFTDILAGQFETVIGVDISKGMIDFAQENRSPEIEWVQANANNLPFEDGSIDLIYSNLMIQWCVPLENTLQEIFRVLKPGGLFIFSTLTDETLFELKSSWAQVDDDKHVIDFLTPEQVSYAFRDCHSAIIETKSQDIVLEYENVMHLAHELKGLGANQVPNRVSKGLAGKDAWKQMMKAYEDFIEPSGIYPATYKLFSGIVVKRND